MICNRLIESEDVDKGIKLPFNAFRERKKGNKEPLGQNPAVLVAITKCPWLNCSQAGIPGLGLDADLDLGTLTTSYH